MCLFSTLDEPCSHAECKLINTIKELNRGIFEKEDTINRIAYQPQSSERMIGEQRISSQEKHSSQNIMS